MKYTEGDYKYQLAENENQLVPELVPFMTKHSIIRSDWVKLELFKKTDGTGNLRRCGS